MPPPTELNFHSDFWEGEWKRKWGKTKFKILKKTAESVMFFEKEKSVIFVILAFTVLNELIKMRENSFWGEEAGGGRVKENKL